MPCQPVENSQFFITKKVSSTWVLFRCVQHILTERISLRENLVCLVVHFLRDVHTGHFKGSSLICQSKAKHLFYLNTSGLLSQCVAGLPQPQAWSSSLVLPMWDIAGTLKVSGALGQLHWTRSYISFKRSPSAFEGAWRTHSCSFHWDQTQDLLCVQQTC